MRPPTPGLHDELDLVTQELSALDRELAAWAADGLRERADADRLRLRHEQVLRARARYDQRRVELEQRLSGRSR